MDAKLTKIPLQGGSEAVPSGALQFQDDWPGLFLRGDNAVVFGARIKSLLEVLKEKKLEDSRISSALLQLEEMSDVIDRLVLAKPSPDETA